MKNTNFKWKLESLAKGVDPEKAEKELKRIERKFGGLTPEKLLEVSRSKKALFHSLFQWDDSTAAEQYRLQQARTIINNIEITIISDGEETNISAYEIITAKDEEGKNNRFYKRIDALSYSEVEYIKNQTLAQLKSLSKKLAIFKDFDDVLLFINKAVIKLEQIEPLIQ